MGAITDKDFQNQIKGGTFGRLYLLYGEEAYQKALYRERLAERISGGEMQSFNKSVIEGKGFSPKLLYDEAERLPVFAEKRLVEIVDLKPSTMSDNAFKELEEIFSDIAESTVIVFYMQTEELSQKERKTDKRFIELINKYGFTVDFSLKDTDWLAKYLMSRLNKAKIEIDYDTAYFVAENSSGEISYINNESEKLISYCEKGKITIDDAKKVISKSVDASRYDLAKFLVAKDIEKTLRELDSLLFMKVKPMQILTAISSCIYDMYIVLSADTAKKSENDIMSDFSGYKNRGFVLRNARRNLSRFSVRDIENAVLLINKAEDELKGGKMDDRLVLERLVVKIIKGSAL